MISNHFVNTMRVSDDMISVRDMYEPYTALVRVRDSFVYLAFVDLSSVVLFDEPEKGVGVIVSDNPEIETFPFDAIFEYASHKQEHTLEAIALITELLKEAEEVFKESEEVLSKA